MPRKLFKGGNYLQKYGTYICLVHFLNPKGLSQRKQNTNQSKNIFSRLIQELKMRKYQIKTERLCDRKNDRIKLLSKALTFILALPQIEKLKVSKSQKQFFLKLHCPKTRWKRSHFWFQIWHFTLFLLPLHIPATAYGPMGSRQQF